MLLKKSHMSRPWLMCDFFLLQDSAPGVGEDIVDSAQQSACLSSDFPDYFHRAAPPQTKLKSIWAGWGPALIPDIHPALWATAPPPPGETLRTLSVTLRPWTSLSSAFKPRPWLFLSARAWFLAAGGPGEGRLERTCTLAFNSGCADRGRNIFCGSPDAQTLERGDCAAAVILRHSQPSRLDEFQQQLMNLSSGSCCLKVAQWLLAALPWSWSGRTAVFLPPFNPHAASPFNLPVCNGKDCQGLAI